MVTQLIQCDYRGVRWDVTLCILHRGTEVLGLAAIIPWHFLSQCSLQIGRRSLWLEASGPGEGQQRGNAGELGSEAFLGFAGTQNDSSVGKKEHPQHSGNQRTAALHW